MSTSVFPGALDNDTNLIRRINTDALIVADHNNLVDAIEAIEGFLATFANGARSDGDVLTAHAAASIGYEWLAGGGGGGGNYCYLREEQASGTNGGTSTAGSYAARVLNTKVVDTGGVCTLAANQFTLVAGTYRIAARAPGEDCGRNKLILYDVTSAAVLLVGAGAFHGAANVETDATLKGRFTVAAAHALELRWMCETGLASIGLGVACSFGDSEVYAEVELFS